MSRREFPPPPLIAPMPSKVRPPLAPLTAMVVVVAALAAGAPAEKPNEPSSTAMARIVNPRSRRGGIEVTVVPSGVGPPRVGGASAPWRARKRGGAYPHQRHG